MTFQDALDYVWGLVNFETRPPETREPYTLDRFYALLGAIDNPHRGLVAVHIAGSKGKGSISAMIDAILRAAGYRVGFYSSPHLHDPRERIRVDGEMISEEDFIALVERLRPVADALGNVTTFEFLTAMAFVHFAEVAIDIAVVEVGLGGRLDATNVLQPLVAVIAAIGLEHTKILGATIPEIAAEKGGIIKRGTPVVIAPQVAEARQTLVRIAAERDAPVTLVDETWWWEGREVMPEGQRFDLGWRRSPSGATAGALESDEVYSNLFIPLHGAHQVANAATTVAAIRELQAAGIDVVEGALRQGLASVQWPARIEILERRPLVIVDGAHTDVSAGALVATIQELRAAGVIRWQRLWLIFGTSQDKNPASVLAPLLPLVDQLVLTAAWHPRASPPDEVLGQLQRAGVALPLVRKEATVREAVAAATRRMGLEDALIITGSLFVAAEGRAVWLQGLTLHADP